MAHASTSDDAIRWWLENLRDDPNPGREDYERLHHAVRSALNAAQGRWGSDSHQVAMAEYVRLALKGKGSWSVADAREALRAIERPGPARAQCLADALEEIMSYGRSLGSGSWLRIDLEKDVREALGA